VAGRAPQLVSGTPLCVQVCSVLSMGTTVVVSPLISLMQDQVQLVSNLGDGVSAACLFSGQTDAEALSIYRELHKPTPLLQLLFLTPERLSTPSLTEIFNKLYASVGGRAVV
jgi:ATP-dependent DNA helicase RecQ